MAIERTFQDIPEGKLNEADQQPFLVNMGWARADGWQDLLRSKRVLIISEAGGGKTYECRAQCQRLWNEGEPAFFLELATLAASDLRSMLSQEEEFRLEMWLSSQSDIATFFLDSFDELKLNLGSFEQALKRLGKSIGKPLLRRARIIITTRPIPFDEELVQRFLPIPSAPQTEIEVNGDAFAQIVMQGRPKEQDSVSDAAPAEWRTVGLLPLSDSQIKEFARDQGVNDPESLLVDLRRRNAEEFARRPQDLIELCADWRNFKRIRTHKEQVTANIRIKLKPREDRPEPAELSVDKAMDGASRLALALMLTRRLTLRHNAKTDVAGEGVALDPSVILSDWSAGEIKALLERPLFGFASYGRVRFHHRSIAEYLAAGRIQTLRANGMTTRALKRLIFTETKGKLIARPSKRSIAGWLALDDDMVFETLRDHEPAVLLTEGDPESLTLPRRKEALRAYVERYGKGGWRGLSVPHIQIHRFADSELAEEINLLWGHGIENQEIREILLQLIDFGRMTGCAQLAREAAANGNLSLYERLAAIEALATLEDPVLETITAEIARDPTLWPDGLAREVALRLFPGNLSVERFCRILAQVRDREDSLTDLSWRLVPLISTADLDGAQLALLRDMLVGLVSERLGWENEWSDLVSDHSQLSAGLAAVCVRGLGSGVTEEWLRASALSSRVTGTRDSNKDIFSELGTLLAELPSDANTKLFWIYDELRQSVLPTTNPWKRYSWIACRGAFRIDLERDGEWVKAALADPARPLAERELLLEAAIRLAPNRKVWNGHVVGLKSLVADQPELLSAINERLKPSKDDAAQRRWEIEEMERTKSREQQKEEARSGWVAFWRDVSERPEIAFSPEQGGNTAWHLWGAMRKASGEDRAEGWNRRFIETYFDKKTADRLRLTLMDQWRGDCPTLESERPEDEKGKYLVRWNLGLAAIYAEAEDPRWAGKLSKEEARLASRYALLKLNSLPSWMEALATAHPDAVETVVGKELLVELESEAQRHWHSMLLQKIGGSQESVVALFLPRLRQWFDANASPAPTIRHEGGVVERLQQVVHLLKTHGNDETQSHLCDLARKRLGEKPSPSFARLWMQLLMHFDVETGVAALEDRIQGIEPAKHSEAVTLFGTLFGDFFGNRHSGVSLADPRFTPSILLRLLRLSHRHVLPEHDNKHSGAYSPNERDQAERMRSAIINVLLRSNGEEGWMAKVEMAADPICAHFKDRILAVAEEHWAEEVDADALDEMQAVALDKTGEAPPSTNEAIFAIMVDRLGDLDDLLLRDVSPREAWAGITDERVMRREIARELSHHANGLYKIDQESVTADEKETDIRLRSTASDHEAVIELKLADDRSARDLLDTLEVQLVTKYMAAENSRSGCLLLTLAKERSWDHPDDGSRIGFPELLALLREEATKIMERLGGSLRLHVHALDFRPRLPTEAKKTRAKKGGKKPS